MASIKMRFLDPYPLSIRICALTPIESAHAFNSNPLPIEQKTELYLKTF
jgi:hypothetical protein